MEESPGAPAWRRLTLQGRALSCRKMRVTVREAGTNASHKIPFMFNYVLTFTHTFLKSHIKTLTKENKPFRRPLGQNYRDALFRHKPK